MNEEAEQHYLDHLEREAQGEDEFLQNEIQADYGHGYVYKVTTSGGNLGGIAQTTWMSIIFKNREDCLAYFINALVDIKESGEELISAEFGYRGGDS